MSATAQSFLSPPQVAERLGISSEKVIGWLLAGELKGSNLAARTNGRPRYRISEDDLADFLECRSAEVATGSVRPSNRKAATSGRRFYT